MNAACEAHRSASASGGGLAKWRRERRAFQAKETVHSWVWRYQRVCHYCGMLRNLWLELEMYVGRQEGGVSVNRLCDEAVHPISSCLQTIKVGKKSLQYNFHDDSFWRKVHISKYSRTK